MRKDAYDYPRVWRGRADRCLKRLSADIVPVSVKPWSDVSSTLWIKCSHVDGAVLLEHCKGVLFLVVERDVDADRLHEFDLIFRARRRDHLEAVGLGKLDDSAALGFR